MGSKKKAEEDIPCEEHGNPPKKMKINTLVLEDENHNMANFSNLEAMFKQGVDLRKTVKLMLNELQAFVQHPVQYPAAIIDHIVELIARKFPRVHVMKKKKTIPDFVIIPPIIDPQNLIDVLELFGAAFVFQGKANYRKLGWICWCQATILREKYEIAKVNLPQSELGKLFFRKKREFENAEELFKLYPQKREEKWKTQAFFICHRISQQDSSLPKRFVVYNLFKFTLQGWKERDLPRHRAVALSLHLFELFGKTDFLDDLVRNQTNLEDVVHSSITEFFNTLRDPKQSDLTELATVLTFDHLMTSLVFSFVYQVKVHEYARKDQLKIKDYTIKSKADKLEEISQLILVILKLLVPMPKSEAESKRLKIHLKSYIVNFENKALNKNQSTLLLRASKDYRGFSDDFHLIMLLLETDGDPNAVDEHGRSPLHLIASSERFFYVFWSSDYQTHAERFTRIVRTFLDGRFHPDQTDFRGNYALDCLKKFSERYPNAELCKIMDSYLQVVRPLSCLAAKAVRKHQLPCELLPDKLQYMVKQHSSNQYF